MAIKRAAPKPRDKSPSSSTKVPALDQEEAMTAIYEIAKNPIFAKIVERDCKSSVQQIRDFLLAFTWAWSANMDGSVAFKYLSSEQVRSIQTETLAPVEMKQASSADPAVTELRRTQQWDADIARIAAMLLVLSGIERSANKPLSLPISVSPTLGWLGNFILGNLAMMGDVAALRFGMQRAIVHLQSGRKDYFERPDRRLWHERLKSMLSGESVAPTLLTAAARYAKATGQEDVAVAFYDRALKPAQVEYVQNSLSDTYPDTSATWHFGEQRGSADENPWAELAKLRHSRASKLTAKHQDQDRAVELEGMRRAIDAGCELNDYLSNYQRAEYLLNKPDGSIPDSSHEWLACMNKAAAQGFPHAAYRLAEYYFQLKHQPVSDERPSTLDQLQWPNMSSHTFNDSSIVQPVLSPQTLQHSWLTGVFWAEIAAKYYYAPAYMLLAEAYLRANLTQDSKVEIRNTRYSESKARTMIEQLYQILHCKHLIDSIFEKHFRAHGTPPHATYERKVRGMRRSIEEYERAEGVKPFPPWVVDRFRFAEEFEHWLPEAENLENMARDICDAQNWTIRAPNGVIFYQANNRNMKTVLNGAGFDQQRR